MRFMLELYNIKYTFLQESPDKILQKVENLISKLPHIMCIDVLKLSTISKKNVKKSHFIQIC